MLSLISLYLEEIRPSEFGIRSLPAYFLLRRQFCGRAGLQLPTLRRCHNPTFFPVSKSERIYLKILMNEESKEKAINKTNNEIRNEKLKTRPEGN